MPIVEFYTVDTTFQKLSNISNGRDAKWTSIFTYASNSRELCELDKYLMPIGINLSLQQKPIFKTMIATKCNSSQV